MTGGASLSYFGPEYLIEQKVLLVTIQYRLGALGKCFHNYVTVNVRNLDVDMRRLMFEIPFSLHGIGYHCESAFSFLCKL